MISVIIPVHNVEKYLDRCIKSVLDNTYKDLEIILVENGSSDNSLQLCRKYEAAYANINVIVAEFPNLSHARNLGIKYAQGDYIAFVDSDDYISPYMYETLWNCAIENNLDLVFCSCISGTDEDYVFPIPTRIHTAPMDKTVYLHNAYMQAQMIYSAAWNKLIRRSVATQFAYDETLIYFEDRNYSVKCVCGANQIGFVNEPLYYYYRGNATSISSAAIAANRMYQIFSLEKDLQFFLEYYPNQPLWAEFVNACLLQNADFRLKRAKELGLKEHQDILIPIIRSAKERLAHSTHISKLEKYRYLFEHDFPMFFQLVYRILKKVGYK